MTSTHETAAQAALDYFLAGPAGGPALAVSSTERNLEMGRRALLSDSADLVQRLIALTRVSAAKGLVFNWTQIEQDLALVLPDDYRLLAEKLPLGWFRRFIRPGKPVNLPDGTQRLLAGAEGKKLNALREWQAAGRGQLPYLLYPEPGGLLPWGRVRFPGHAFWLTGGSDPAGWPVIIASESLDHWERYDGTTVEFLIDVATARYDASGFTEGPTRVTVDIAGNVSRNDQPIILADRPVFEPGTAPAASPPPPPPPPRPAVPPRTYWKDKLDKLGEWPMANEMPALREMIGKPSSLVARVDWGAVHTQLGFDLPADYREFIDTVGAGQFGNIRIAAPGSPGEMDLFALMVRKYKQVRSVTQIGSPPPFFPEPGGTVCWGETTDGWTCGWAPVSDNPDKWIATGMLFNPQFRTLVFRPGVSFSSMLKEHARPEEFVQELVPPWDAAAGPVTFNAANAACSSCGCRKPVPPGQMYFISPSTRCRVWYLGG